MSSTSGWRPSSSCTRSAKASIVLFLVVFFLAVDISIDGVHLSQHFIGSFSIDRTDDAAATADPDFSSSRGHDTVTSHRDPFFSPRWREDAPCWCAELHNQIKRSIELLTNRYGRKHLKASIQYSTSGLENNLEQRLLRSLNSGAKDPFHIAILGGSYSLPNAYNGNAWAFNVTRWLNNVLSTGSCDIKAVQPVSVTNAHALCKNKTSFMPSELYKNCPSSTSITHNGAVFCSRFSGDPNEDRAMHPNAKRLDDICDSSVPPLRNCNVYGGSGRYATMVMGSKGGTTTNSGVWAIDSIYNNDEIDLMIWDYGMNDMATIPFHKEFLSGFFEKVVYTYPNISAIAAAYWIDESTPLQAQCVSNNGSVTWSNDLPALDYPILKSKFNIENGKFRNHSLISMSLSAFCASAKCVPNDILGANTNHPSDGGTSIMGDLFIWQLIHAFKRILRRECNQGERTYEHSNDNDLWTLDFHDPSYNLTLKQTQQFQRTDINPYFKKNLTDLVWPVGILFTICTTCNSQLISLHIHTYISSHIYFNICILAYIS